MKGEEPVEFGFFNPVVRGSCSVFYCHFNHAGTIQNQINYTPCS